MSKPGDAAEEALSLEELERQTGEALPKREALSTITGTGVDNFAVPINEALAVNVQSSDSYAIADADQIVILNQTSVDAAPTDATTDVITHVHPGKG
jgi:hypothetical protein